MAVRDAMPNSGTYPLILYSHASGGHRRAATFLCTHLCSHGFVVAALDHSEVVGPELAKKNGETEEQKHARWDAVIASRVPDVRFLLELLCEGQEWKPEVKLDFAGIGIVGHSFGAWTALAINDVEPRIGAVVALAPGGASNPRPGILPVKLEFKWSHDVPTLYLVAENDVSLPLSGMYEIFGRTPAAKRMVILRRADHLHFMDNVDEIHELVRKMPVPSELAWMQEEMLPISELHSGEKANLFVRGLTLTHFDAVLSRNREARDFLAGDLESELARRSIEIISHRP
jgi:predicted dienelactone hydrolase